MAGQKQSGQTDAAEDVGIEEPHPVRVGDFLERLRFENPEIVPQNRDFGIALREFLGSRRLGEMAGEAQNVAAGRLLQLRDDAIDGRTGPAVDDHARALLREGGGDGQPDAGGAAAHEREFALEMQVHDVFLSPNSVSDVTRSGAAPFRSVLHPF